MKARIYKSKDFKVGWFWEIHGEHWEVVEYAFTKWGAIAGAKRFLRKQQRVMPSFEITIEEDKE